MRAARSSLRTTRAYGVWDRLHEPLIIVALVGAAAEMATAFSAARKDRLDLSVGIALGSASQISLFVAPVIIYGVWHQTTATPSENFLMPA